MQILMQCWQYLLLSKSLSFLYIKNWIFVFMWGTHVPSDSSFQVIYYALALILIFDPSESHKNRDSLFIILCFDLLSTSVRSDIRNFHIYLMCRPVV